jgi:hypothetical protein
VLLKNVLRPAGDAAAHSVLGLSTGPGTTTYRRRLRFENSRNSQS